MKYCIQNGVIGSLVHCHYVVSQLCEQCLEFFGKSGFDRFCYFLFCLFFLQNINLICNFLVYKCLQIKISCLNLFSVRSCVFSLLF